MGGKVPQFGSVQKNRPICNPMVTAFTNRDGGLAAELRKMGFVPTKADLDLWIKQARDGTYEYIA
jgi:phosphorylcholine metabolism protein LicD